ncbi:hypothetical protein [Paraburkholderia sp. BL21I4N1]|uniref:hypothetical protein n=1 Tax=Paraburkholderia sp. BL21I4N1 TaxID=1938801 RepID=UPI000CFC4B79|nr:hypothetical protein [Paraburkholderia sp. BL21I4N1]PQV45821.1 hypothetical protein B0G83_11559 [Paraburkholderia sp. BL21I4N1]
MTKLKLVAGTEMKGAGRKPRRLAAGGADQMTCHSATATEASTRKAMESRPARRNISAVMEDSAQRKKTMRDPDTVTMNAIEIAFAALDEYPGTQKDKGLRALRDVLRAAMIHAGNDGATPESTQAFYDKVADLACDTAMSWHCTMTPGLLAAFEVRAQSGNLAAKQFLENLRKSGLSVR